MNTEAVEYVRGIPVVKVFQQTVFSFKNFYNSIIRYRDMVTAYTRMWRFPMSAYATIINSFAFILVPVSILLIGESGDYSTNEYLNKALHPGMPIEHTVRYYALLFLNVRINRMNELEAMPVQQGKTAFEPQNHDIEFCNVHFAYEHGKEVLRNVSFTARQGEITALVGPSGEGKSTCAKLAARFWDIQQGKITLGGQDISTIDPETLLGHYSIVFQDVVLFNASIMDNLRIGKRDAADQDVRRVAKLAQCDEFIRKMPRGYDTIIGENGETLSGGERQRISIARALLKDAPIVLLDEATASLDVENETKIQAGISELIQNKTVLIIAHRMRTVANADKIVVLDGGTVAESGTPEQLKKQNGIFAKMIARQTA